MDTILETMYDEADKVYEAISDAISNVDILADKIETALDLWVDMTKKGKLMGIDDPMEYFLEDEWENLSKLEDIKNIIDWLKKYGR